MNIQAIISIRKTRILDEYDNSHIKLLMRVYPDYNWLPWKFKITNEDFWSERSNQLKYMSWLANHLNFKSNEDWYKVLYKVISQIKSLNNFNKELY